MAYISTLAAEHERRNFNGYRLTNIKRVLFEDRMIRIFFFFIIFGIPKIILKKTIHVHHR